jgi:hypothetical protein
MCQEENGGSLHKLRYRISSASIFDFYTINSFSKGNEDTNKNNNMKGLKDEFNQNVKNGISQDSYGKNYDIEVEKKVLNRSESKINFPLITSSDISIPNSPSKANTSSPSSLSSSFKILPPIWNNIKVFYFVFQKLI